MTSKNTSGKENTSKTDITNNMNKTITITTVIGLALGNFLAGYLLEVSFEKMGAMSFAQAVAAATLYFYHRNK